MSSLANNLGRLISAYRRKGLLVDSNVLLLFFIGAYDRRRITSFKGTRSRGFSEDDFDLLERLMRLFDKIVTTPSILTEVSNLSGQLHGNEKQFYYSGFARGAALFTEHYTKSSDIFGLQHFPIFGLTDSAIISLAGKGFLVLSDDGPLVGYLQNTGVDAINFNHVRSLDWGLS